MLNAVDEGTRLAYATFDNVGMTFTRRGSAPVEALRGMSITINQGEFVALVGPSGCGKSTALSLLAGLATPTSGSVEVSGSPLSGPNVATGVVFQRDLLLPWRTVLNNVLLQFDMRGRRPANAVDRAMELLTMVGIERFAHKYPRELSGGMRQRAAICRALVHDPPALLMDEPFGALDAITREQLVIDLGQIVTQTNKTVVFVTHDIDEAVVLADRVVVMAARPGRIVEEIAIAKARPRTEWPDADVDLLPYATRTRAAIKEYR
jgi:NitT/TauT family transport system ATP-binding protein